MALAASLAFVVSAYLLGSFSPAYWLVRVRQGIDLRQYGSGTVGSSNVGEQLGRPWMLVSGVADVLKGLVPVLLARWLGLPDGTEILAGLAVIVGHNWPLWLGFKGGRGLAPTLGVLLALDPRLCFLLLALMGLSGALKLGGPGGIVGMLVLAPAALLLQDSIGVVYAGLALLAIVIVKRLEANRLPLPADPRARRAVLLRRVWLDRDVPLDQPWQERQRIDR